MKYQQAFSTAVLLATSYALPLEPRASLSFDYNTQKVYGVNLGGWFVLEPWITPSIFQPWAGTQQVVDEYTFSATVGKQQAQSQLSAHWNSFITEDDFRQIAAVGLNHVRIPIGYWAVNPQPGDPYVQGQLDVLDRAVGWANTHNLKVMLDLHGAPGSQNGFDNSGRKGPINWPSADPNGNIAKGAITALATRYSANPAVTSIQAINEPLSTTGSLDISFVKQYYYDSWGTIREVNAHLSTPHTVVALHDAFRGVPFWNGFMAPGTSGIDNVMLDTHIYQIFSDGQVAQTPQQHVQSACASAGDLRNADKWTIVGEWTGAQTDCALHLNGFGVGSRYDGSFPGSSYHGSCAGKRTGTVANLSADDKHNLRSFIEAQLDSYAARTGWIFWTWKNEGAPEWHLKDLIAQGLFPQPLGDRRFPAQCG